MSVSMSERRLSNPRIWLVLALCCCSGRAAEGQVDHVTATIDAGKRSDPVSRYEYGMFIEPIGGLIARSLWAEMLDDRKFYYAIVAPGNDVEPPKSVEGRPGVSYRKWRPVGGGNVVAMDTQAAFVGAQSASVTVVSDTPRGFSQAGLGVARAKTYKGHLILSGDPGLKVQVALIWGARPEDRQVVSLHGPTPEWQSFPFEFTAALDSTDARLEVTGVGAGRFRAHVRPRLERNAAERLGHGRIHGAVPSDRCRAVCHGKCRTG
jgi:alpha-N-arabinofuranosidase